MRRRARRSQRGAAGRSRRRAHRASRRTPDTVVHGRGQIWPEGPRLPSLVQPRRETARLVRPALYLDPPLRRRPARHGRQLRSRAAAGLDRGVLPQVSTAAMNEFLARFAATLAEDEHAVLVLDRAGWHTARKLVVPSNITLVWLPPYAPQLHPVERVWLFLRERHLSHRLLNTYTAIVDALCQAWNTLTAERLHSLTSYPYLEQVKV